MKSIKKKILTVALGIITASLSLTTAVGGVLSYNNTIKTLHATMSELATATSGQIENRLDNTRTTIEEIGTIARLSSKEILPTEKKEILSQRIKQYNLLNLTITDINGKDLDGTNVSDQEYFEKSIKGEAYISNLIIEEGKSTSSLIFSAPLWEGGVANTKIIGIVYGKINGDFLSKMTNEISIGETGSAYMLDKKGCVISHKNYDLVISKDNTIEALKTDSKLNELAMLEKDMIEGKTGFGQYSYGGKNKILTYAPIRNTDGWSVAINVEKNEFVNGTYISIFISIGISIVLLILAIIIFVLFANSITKPIKEIEAAAKEMSNGNLQVNIIHKGNDELGQLADSFNITITRLRAYINDISRGCSEIAKGNFDIAPTEEFKGDFVEIEKSLIDITNSLSDTLGQISIASEQVASGSDQVSSGAQALAQGATEQAGSIEELSASIAEISEQIKQNANNAMNSNKKISIVGTEINLSNEKMRNMISAMKDINTKSAEIGTIIKAIDDIAFQTNILALNAAVEAARAGSAGKGFAVVAGEVKNLANKSAAAAKDITALIEDSINSIEKGTSIADETAKSLNGVVANTMETIELIKNISEASNEQANSIFQVNQGVEQISEIVQTNSATAEESSAASEELNAQAESLKHLVAKFNLKSTHYQNEGGSSNFNY